MRKYWELLRFGSNVRYELQSTLPRRLWTMGGTKHPVHVIASGTHV